MQRGKLLHADVIVAERPDRHHGCGAPSLPGARGLNPTQGSPTHNNRDRKSQYRIWWWKISGDSLHLGDSEHTLLGWITPIIAQAWRVHGPDSDGWKVYSALFGSCGRACWLHPTVTFFWRGFRWKLRQWT